MCVALSCFKTEVQGCFMKRFEAFACLALVSEINNMWQARGLDR